MQEFLEATILSSELDSFTFRFFFKQDKVKETFLTFYLKVFVNIQKGFLIQDVFLSLCFKPLLFKCQPAQCEAYSKFVLFCLLWEPNANF